MLDENQIFLVLILLTILSTALLIWTIIQQKIISRLSRDQKLFFSGGKGKDLEKVLLETKQKLSSIDSDIKALFSATGKIHSISQNGIQKIGLLRFNPFKDIGGDQSFALALLDGKNNGFVISSLYSREGMRIYCKKITDGKSSQHPLTQEEIQAISIAIEKK